MRLPTRALPWAQKRQRHTTGRFTFALVLRTLGCYATAWSTRSHTRSMTRALGQKPMFAHQSESRQGVTTMLPSASTDQKRPEVLALSGSVSTSRCLCRKCRARRPTTCSIASTIALLALRSGCRVVSIGLWISYLTERTIRSGLRVLRSVRR